MNNLFAEIPRGMPSELIEVLSSSEETRIERVVSQGHSSPEGFWYDQENNEFVVLISGMASLLFEGDESPRELKQGDWLVIPAHARHRVVSTSPDCDTIWLCVHYK